MKKNTKILLGIAAMAGTAILVYGIRSRTRRKMLNQVAEEGYETAHDVLFPQKSSMGKKLHLGPIIPTL